MSLYVKKNGVVKKLAGVPKGWNAVKKFNVPATLWEANTDTQTSSTYPYIAEITTDYFSDDSAPTWQMNGVGTLPTETELPSINMVLDAIFLSTGVTLYATDQPTEDLVLETGMFVKGYSTSAAPAADISFDPSLTDLSSTNVQDAIVEVSSSSSLTPLWTNPNDTLAGNTKIPLDLSNYDYIDVEAAFMPDGLVFWQRFTVGTSSTLYMYRLNYQTAQTAFNTINACSRDITVASDGVTFGPAYMLYDYNFYTNMPDARCIPKRIFGGKF